MKKLFTACIITLTLAVLSNIASAITNGGFETGDFTGWFTIGVASVTTAEFGAGPTEGTYQALMATDGEGGAASDAAIETFLGLAAGTLDSLIGSDGVTEGSAIKQLVTANAGDTLMFDWNFLSEEVDADDGIPDFAFFSVISETTAILADAVNSTFVSSNTSFIDETGFSTLSYTFTTSGNFIIGLGVMDAYDTSVRSGLLIDNVTIVPEPATICLLGLGGLSLLRKKR